MMRYYAITLGFCKVVMNAAALQAVFDTFVAVLQSSFQCPYKQGNS